MLFYKPAILLAQSRLLLSHLGDASGKIWKETRKDDLLQTVVLLYNKEHVFHPDWLHSTQNMFFVRRYDPVVRKTDPNLTSSFSRWKKFPNNPVFFFEGVLYYTVHKICCLEGYMTQLWQTLTQIWPRLFLGERRRVVPHCPTHFLPQRIFLCIAIDHMSNCISNF